MKKKLLVFALTSLLMLSACGSKKDPTPTPSPTPTPVDPVDPPSPPAPTEIVYSIKLGGNSIKLTQNQQDKSKYEASLTNLSKNTTVVFLKDDKAITTNISSEQESDTNKNLIQGSAGNFYIHNQVSSSSLTFTVSETSYTFWATGYEESVDPTPGEYDVSSYYDGYYTPIVSWTDGEDLKNQLHDLITDGFNGLTYDDPNWETNQYSEQSLTDFKYVDVVYSQTDFLKTDTYNKGNGWQREHSFCASLMTGYATTESVNVYQSGTSRATDWHNLFASYGQGNGARGNKNFGISDKEHPSSGTGAPLADYTADVLNFEPNDCDKGQLARAIFYMGVMYNEVEESTITLQLKYDGSHTKNIQVPAVYQPLTIQEDYVPYSKITFNDFCMSTAEDVAAVRAQYLAGGQPLDPAQINNTEYTGKYAKAYSDYSVANCQFAIGNLSTLLTWNDLAVTRREMQHNESVYSHVYAKRDKAQNNRNPFVDYPELVDYVYGIKKDQPGQMKNICPSEELLETNSGEVCNYALTDYKNEYYVGDTFTKADYSLIRVNKDFSTQEIDFTDETPDYTFVEGDAGEKEIQIQTPINTLTYKVNVIAESPGINTCSYVHNLTGKTSGGDFEEYNDSKSKGYKYIKQNNLLHFDNNNENQDPATLDWYGYWENGCVGGYNADKGVTFGSQNSGTTNDPCEYLSFTSLDSLKVDAVYIEGNTGSGKSYTMNIYCDDQIIKTDTITYQSGPTEYGIKLENPVTGKIKIEFTGLNGLIVLKSIGVNVVE